jgi:hypothetical protein
VAGTAGRGGGASIAVLAIDSPLVLRAMTLETGAGGKAGQGTVGSSGTPGGAGGLSSHPQNLGVAGVAGTNGGISGSGGGGPSIGVVIKGPKPSIEDLTFIGGSAGAGALPVQRDGRTLPASPAGIAAQEHVVL